MAAADPSDRLSRWITYREIVAQPRIWRDWAKPLEIYASEIAAWFIPTAYDEIWLCGAGTSAYIGEALAAHLNRAPHPLRYRAIATTDLVASPGSYLRPHTTILVVSFGRSGDSPETLGLLDLLDTHMPRADQLHFTCNPQGALAQRKSKGLGRRSVVLLPPETNDAGFAMTSSYTTMLISALVCLSPSLAASLEARITSLAAGAEDVISDMLLRMDDAAPCPSRTVFLGSGVLTAFAREAALKVLELTHGRIPAYWETAMGFRHGPKAILDAEAQVFSFLSSDPHTRQYEVDGAEELRCQFGASVAATLGPEGCDSDITVKGAEEDIWRGVLYVLAAQLLAVWWSDRLGFNVDNPFAEGNLSRVVAGVTLYPYQPKVTT
ncbi:MAG: glucokinase family protein [Cypionkella sp.]|uniref:SIS domain-containing protein n=1 Tax=Cypionkella sp. TaxID=2811411 RepID=UPI00263575C8|nr:SIS domain-containing protein [Cypionkella sp.]MDB5659428.1 glucokinase family protein [Cypionkella sp.]